MAGLTALAAGDPVDGDETVRAWRAGADLPVPPGRRVPLPGYPFRRTRHWIEARR
ncbi:hypothetical protein V2I01_42920 [Micromonospora sp. BRA006-A]|nr:hypothetical protein [Micromonospora sp. BRA006-A]